MYICIHVYVYICVHVYMYKRVYSGECAGAVVWGQLRVTCVSDSSIRAAATTHVLLKTYK